MPTFTTTSSRSAISSSVLQGKPRACQRRSPPKTGSDSAWQCQDTRPTRSSGPRMVRASRQCSPTRSTPVANASSSAEVLDHPCGFILGARCPHRHRPLRRAGQVGALRASLRPQPGKWPNCRYTGDGGERLTTLVPLGS